MLPLDVTVSVGGTSWVDGMTDNVGVGRAAVGSGEMTTDGACSRTDGASDAEAEGAAVAVAVASGSASVSRLTGSQRFGTAATMLMALSVLSGLSSTAEAGAPKETVSSRAVAVAVDA